MLDPGNRDDSPPEVGRGAETEREQGKSWGPIANNAAATTACRTAAGFDKIARRLLSREESAQILLVAELELVPSPRMLDD